MKKIYQMLSIFAFAIFPLAIYSQDDSLSVDKQHMSEVIEGHLASLEGWRKGDVLIRWTKSAQGRHFRSVKQEDGTSRRVYMEGPDAMSVVVRGDLLFRVVFDFDEQRALVINRNEHEERLFDGLDNDAGRPIRRNDDRVLLYDKSNNRVLARLEAGAIHGFPGVPPSVDEMISSWGVPNIKALGGSQSLADSWEAMPRIRHQYELSGSVDAIAKITNIGKNRHQVESHFGVPSFRGRFLVDWDTARNVPLKLVVYHSVDEDATPVETYTTEWTSIDGHFLPAYARKWEKGSQSFGSRSFYLEEDETFEMHWFSFNEELPEELFDEKLLHDRRKLDELLSEDVFEKKSEEKRDP